MELEIDNIGCTWPDKCLRPAWSYNTISSATLLSGSSFKIEEIESDTYSSDIGASDRNMSLLSEMYLEASRINKSRNNVYFVII